MANVGEMEIPISVAMKEEELPILDRLARLEQATADERMRRQEWESIVEGRLSRIERVTPLERGEARRAVANYRRALREGKHEQLRREDEAILRGYREIAAGRPIISIAEVIRAGGERDFLPKLAIARADETRVQVRRYRDGSVSFAGDFLHPPRSLVSLPERTCVPYPSWQRWSRTRGGGGRIEAESIVPTIPPELRPLAWHARYWILFEAEWKNVAPRDPALLRPLGGGLYAVVATWDLSEIERLVLGWTRR